MIFNRPRAKKKVSLTWYFNEIVKIPSQRLYCEAAFVSRGKSCKGIRVTTGGINYISMTGKADWVYHTKKNLGWLNQEDRTVAFEEEPTGDLLAFLQANATPL